MSEGALFATGMGALASVYAFGGLVMYVLWWLEDQSFWASAEEKRIIALVRKSDPRDWEITQRDAWSPRLGLYIEHGYGKRGAKAYWGRKLRDSRYPEWGWKEPDTPPVIDSYGRASNGLYRAFFHVRMAAIERSFNDSRPWASER